MSGSGKLLLPTDTNTATAAQAKPVDYHRDQKLGQLPPYGSDEGLAGSQIDQSLEKLTNLGQGVTP